MDNLPRSRIQSHMEKLRNGMETQVSDVTHDARELLDWKRQIKEQIKRHPIITAVVASAVVWVIFRRPKVIVRHYPTGKTSNQKDVKALGYDGGSTGFSLIGTLGKNLLLRGASIAATSFLRDSLDSQSQSREASDRQSREPGQNGARLNRRN